MDEAKRQAVFSSQTKNVRRLTSAKKQVKRTINAALRRANQPSEEAHTLVLALLYCAWLEASFSKLIHTPHGFTLDEIDQIKKEQRQNGISMAWKKTVELGTRRVGSTRSSYVPNIKKKLGALIDDFVKEPSLLRNKIAHGQWSVALNRENTAPNHSVSKDIQNLDVVQIEKWIMVANRICSIVEALVASPARAFHRDYWVELGELETDVARTKGWNRSQKLASLRRKSARAVEASTDSAAKA